MNDVAVSERLRDAPPVARWIVRTLEDGGFETWAVGGAIRDAALGVANQDWDFATRARPRDVQRLFPRTVAIGADHGTIGVIGKDRRLHEVTTFRRDVKPLGRRAVVEFAETLEEDLARRDFTINAVAWHPFRHELRDPFQGIADMAAGILRTVGAPEERFREDRLRVLRGLRFAARYGLEPTPSTWAAMVASAPELHHLSAERVREELMKTLAAVDRASEGLELYASAGVLGELFPEFDALRADEVSPGGPTRWERGIRSADVLPKSRSLLRLAGLVTEVVDGAGVEIALAMMTRLRFSGAQTNLVLTWSLAQLDVPAVEATEENATDEPGPRLRRWLGRVEPAARLGALRLVLARARAAGQLGLTEPEAALRSVRALRAEMHDHPPLAVGELAVDGKDVIRMGLRPGPRVGEVLQALLEAVLDDPSRNDRDHLLEETARLIAAGAAK